MRIKYITVVVDYLEGYEANTKGFHSGENVLTDSTCEYSPNYGGAGATKMWPANFFIGRVNNNPQAYMTIDLGRMVAITSLDMRNSYNGDHGGMSAQSIEIHTSEDFTTWTTAGSGSLTPVLSKPAGCTPPPLETITLNTASVNARFVKILFTDIPSGAVGIALNYVYINYNEI